MATWPSSIPQTPVIGNYQGSVPNQILIGDMAVGPRMRRQRSTFNTYPISCAFKMRKAQATSLFNFYQNTLSNGTTAFTWSNPYTGATVSAHFIEPPKLAAMFFDWYEVQAEIQIIP